MCLKKVESPLAFLAKFLQPAMLSTADTLVPARFLVMTSHFMATIMVAWTMDGNIRAAMPLGDLTHYELYQVSLWLAIGLSWFCFLTESIGLFSGITLFNRGSNSLLVALHTAATVSLSLFIMNGWN